MIIPKLWVLVFVTLACGGSSQAPCPAPDLCTTQPLNIESASSTQNIILYGLPWLSTAQCTQVLLEEQENADEILWIATFDAGTNSYTFAYQPDRNYLLSTDEVTGVPRICWTSLSTPNFKWILEVADSNCKTYAMKNLWSGTYLQFDPGNNVVFMASRNTANPNQAWAFPWASC